MAVICPQMPDQLRNDLLDKIDLIFPNHLKDTDTRAEGLENVFPTCLFVWWNRFAEQVHFSLLSTIDFLLTSIAYYYREMKPLCMPILLR